MESTRDARARPWIRLAGVTGALVLLVQALLAGQGLLFPKGSVPARTAAAATVTAIAVAEVLSLGLALAWLRREGKGLRDLGLRRRAPARSWAFGIGLGLLTAWWGLSNPLLELPSKLGAVLDPSPWHLYTALVAGTAAGFCEEILFRGLVIEELRAAGYGAWVQILGSAAFFGLAHAGLLRAGAVAALLVAVPTALLGGLYAVIYVNGRRSLGPVIASHFLNDVAVMPWLFLALARRGGLY